MSGTIFLEFSLIGYDCSRPTSSTLPRPTDHCLTELELARLNHSLKPTSTPTPSSRWYAPLAMSSRATAPNYFADLRRFFSSFRRAVAHHRPSTTTHATLYKQTNHVGFLTNPGHPPTWTCLARARSRPHSRCARRTKSLHKRCARGSMP